MKRANVGLAEGVREDGDLVYIPAEGPIEPVPLRQALEERYLA